MENSFEDLSKVTFYTKPETDLSYITMTPRKLVHHRKLVLSSFFVCRFFDTFLAKQTPAPTLIGAKIFKDTLFVMYNIVGLLKLDFPSIHSPKSQNYF